MENKKIFNTIETTEKPSLTTKDAVFSEIEIIQNVGQILEHFSDKFFKTLIESFSSGKKIE